MEIQIFNQIQKSKFNFFCNFKFLRLDSNIQSKSFLNIDEMFNKLSRGELIIFVH